MLNFRKKVKVSSKSPKHKKPLRSSVSAPDNDAQRLQKILAFAGFGSRRACEELIVQGRIEVNGSVAKLGCRVRPNEDIITVDGQKLKQPKKLVYLALFKPKGYLCTNSDQQGRVRALDLIPESFGRLFLVGRLDKDSEGLILLTNDGELTERLTHPRYGVPKVYRVMVAGEFKPEDAKQLREGVYLAEGVAKAERVLIKQHYKHSTIIDITLSEGRNREVRRLLAKTGHKVMMLIRTAVGPVKIGQLAAGEWRQLTKSEINSLYTAAKKDKPAR